MVDYIPISNNCPAHYFPSSLIGTMDMADVSISVDIALPVPKAGLGAAEPPTQGCKAVKCIKLLCKRAIQLSTLDEASAIDGSRPLEQIADACGIAWGSTNVQMTADLTGFNVLLMVGKGFTPAQQAWPPWHRNLLPGSQPCAHA